MTAYLPIAPPRARRRRLSPRLQVAALLAVFFFLLVAERRAAMFFVHVASPPLFRPRLPPERLVHWQEYAAARNCSLDDADYTQIFKQLQPFREAGITPELIKHTYAKLSYNGGVQQIVHFVIRNGVANVSAGNRDQNIDFLYEVLPGFIAYLPDLELVLNEFDQPAIWSAPLQPTIDAAIRSGALSAGNAFATFGCDSVGLEAVRQQVVHGTFARQGYFGPLERELLPVFSWSTMGDCFADIAFPYRSNNDPYDLVNILHVDACPFGQIEWEQKKPVAYWRGTTTGAYVDGGIPPGAMPSCPLLTVQAKLNGLTLLDVADINAEDWRRFHRQRLVAYSKDHPSHVDAAFTGFLNCETTQCAAMEAEYGKAPTAAFVEEMDKHRFVISVDGNGYPMRNRGVLCSGSLALLGGMFTSWFSNRLEPNKHYLPIRHDYSDLVDQVEWARQHDAEARRIADAGAELARTRLREADAACYWYRLLLEYGSIFRAG